MHLFRRHDEIDHRTLTKIAGEDGVAITVQERAFLVFGVVALLAVASLFTFGAIVGDLADAPWAKASALLYFSFMPWLAWFIIRRARFGKVTRAMLKYRRCPHCGYDLHALPVADEDGATICPECGCAWMLPESDTDEEPPNEQ